MSDGIRINLICCTQVIQQDLAHKEITQKHIATVYAMAIKSESEGVDKPDWKVINAAIIARWGERGLRRIKNAAWRFFA